MDFIGRCRNWDKVQFHVCSTGWYNTSPLVNESVIIARISRTRHRRIIRLNNAAWLNVLAVVNATRKTYVCTRAPIVVVCVMSKSLIQMCTCANWIDTTVIKNRDLLSNVWTGDLCSRGVDPLRYKSASASFGEYVTVASGAINLAPLSTLSALPSRKCSVGKPMSHKIVLLFIRLFYCQHAYINLCCVVIVRA